MWFKFLLLGAGLDADGKGGGRGRVIGRQAHQTEHLHRERFWWEEGEEGRRKGGKVCKVKKDTRSRKFRMAHGEKWWLSFPPMARGV